MNKISCVDDINLQSIAQNIANAFSIKPNAPDKLFPVQSQEMFSEYWQVRKFLEHRKWNEITWNSLIYEYKGDEKAILAFLSPEGFAYYLPGFLLIALQIFREEPSFVDAIVFYLTPNRSNELFQRDIERFGCFTTMQCAVIRSWLEYFQEKQNEYPIYVDYALKRYWQSTTG